MLLIVYGSFRSLNIEQEAREREQKKRNESMTNLITGEPVEQEPSKLLRVACFLEGLLTSFAYYYYYCR